MYMLFCKTLLDQLDTRFVTLELVKVAFTGLVQCSSGWPEEMGQIHVATASFCA